MRRRAFLQAAAALAATPGAALAQQGVTPAQLLATARALASAPHVPAQQPLQPPFDAADYDAYRGIRPRPGQAAGLGVGAGFRADLLPPGWLFRTPVRIDLPGHDTGFSPRLFDYAPRYFDGVAVPDTAPGMGFSGLRLRHRLNAPDRWDDVLVIQGASYFRALAEGTVYGLSARALSLGTGGPTPEEFPQIIRIAVFAAGADRLSLGCLIDSPSAAAVLLAQLTPGARTRMACSLRLFPRVALDDAGIAPLTSMFQHNTMGPAAIDDYRPAVHDSDTLIIDNGAGERLWRPLANPAAVQMSAFADSGPSGFGLAQIADRFGQFRDQEGAYHRRPSAWVTPHGAWGAGAVMLLEIPTENEFADNIVAFWRPEARLDPGRAHRFDYTLDWLAPGPAALPRGAAPFIPRRSASGIEPNAGDARLFVIDYTAAPGRTPPDPAGAQPELGETNAGRLHGAAFYPLTDAPGVWRASFIFTPAPGAQVAELRVRLRAHDGAPLAPVWLHRWTRSRNAGP